MTYDAILLDAAAAAALATIQNPTARLEPIPVGPAAYVLPIDILQDPDHATAWPILLSCPPAYLPAPAEQPDP